MALAATLLAGASWIVTGAFPLRAQSRTVTDDFGRIINPMIVAGQIHGGIVQGIGQALMEEARYDQASGQLLAGSLMDYAMPRADDVSDMAVSFNEVLCTTNALGIKGAGEAGSVGSLAAVMNAVVDALAPLGVSHLDMPATPQRIWAAIARAKPARPGGR